MKLFSKIIGTGSYLPPKKITNQQLVERLFVDGIQTSDEWISSRSGINCRHYAEDNVCSSDLAVEAATSALDMAGISPNDIDLIIVATSTPDFFGGFPSTACIVQKKLSIKNQCAAFDVQAVCTGFIYALTTADNFIKSGAHKKVLVIGAEVFSRILDFKDRSSCVLFGDGAGAVVLCADTQPGILATKLNADGQYSDLLCIPGSLNHGAISGNAFLSMNGSAVFKTAVLVLEKIAREVLALSNLCINDIDWFIPHQANIRIMLNTAKKIGLPLEKMVITVNQHGNTSAASIPLAFDYAVRDGRICKGQNILIEGVGGGFTWGAAIVRF